MTTKKPRKMPEIPNALKLRDGKRVNVYLDSPSLKKAADLGGGNVSEGIREALRNTEILDKSARILEDH